MDVFWSFPRFLTISLVFLLTQLQSQAQTDYFWVGGTGNWSDFDNHWATGSGGSTMHTEAPGTDDDVFFDVNSFSTLSQVITLDGFAFCLDMDWTGVTNFPTIFGDGNDIFIYGSLTLASDMTSDLNNVQFWSTNTGNTITTVGTTLGSNSNITFNGIGGEWTLQDNLEVFKVFLTAGTFNTNNNNVNAANRFETNGSDAKALNLGSSEITTQTWFVSGTNNTINSGTSKIEVSSFFFGDLNSDGPFTYYDLQFTDIGFGTIKLKNTSTFNQITIPNDISLELESGSVFTINDLVADGEKHKPINIYSNNSGSEATFNKTTGSITVSYLTLKDVHATGTATFTANNTVNNGNTTGWNINAAIGQDYFWVGNGGDWTGFSNHWATTTGGISMHSDYPGSLDNVFFDANSFSTASEIVTVDLSTNCFNMDWSGVTNSPSFTSEFSVTLEVLGDLTFTDEVNKTIPNITLKGSGNHTLTYADNGSIFNFRFSGTGTYTLQDPVAAFRIFFNDGIVNLNNQPVNARLEIIGGVMLNMGSSEIISDNISIQNHAASPIIDPGTSSIQLSGNLTFNATPDAVTFYDLIIDGTSSIEGSNTFHDVNVMPGSDLTLEEGKTTTINGSLTLNGTKAAPITLNSSLGGSQSTISMNTGTVDATYLILQDIDATGGANFNATQTIDNGNNTGWNISGLTGENYFWVGNSGNWSDFSSHWATSTGGGVFRTTVPGVLDNVIFDANSFSSDGETVTIDDDQANCNDIIATSVSHQFTLTGNSKELNIYGSLDMPNSVTPDVDIFNFLSTSTETINFNDGPDLNNTLTFASSGIWNLSNAITTKQIIFEGGTLNTNNLDINLSSQLSFEGSDPKVLNLGTSTLNLSTLSAISAENITINGGSSEIIVVGTFLIAESPSNNFTLNNLSFVKNISGSIGVLYTDIIVNRFTIEQGKTLQPVSDVTITTNEFVAVGTEMEPIIIQPQTGSSSLTIVQSSGVVNADYLEMEEVIATGGATFNAFNSIDNGGVVGWIFQRDPQTITFDDLEDKTFGIAPFDLVATASSGLEVTFSIISGPATIEGNTITLTGTGMVDVKAEQAGDIDYDPAPSIIKSFQVIKGDQEITFDDLPGKQFADSDFELTATSGSGLIVTYSSSNTAVATINGGTVNILGVGTTTIIASQSGNDNYNPATDVEKLLTISKADQVINLDDIMAKVFGDSPFGITATGGNSETTLIFSSSDEAVATISGSTVTILKAGSTTITVNQDGNSNYNAAIPVEKTLTINKANQTITFDDLADISTGETITLSASSSSNLSVSFEVIGPATLNNNELTTTTTGIVTITAIQSGNDNYNSADNVTQTFDVSESAVTTSIDDEYYMVRIYPNPASQTLIIDGLKNDYDVTIYDINGSISINRRALNSELNISQLKNGTYFLRINQDTFVKKFIIQK